MDRETAKAEIKRQEPDFLERARQKVNGRYSYICPSCGNGSGSSGTGIAIDPHNKTPRYKCFVCGLSEDVIGLWKIHTGITDDTEAFKGLYDYYSIEVDTPAQTAKKDFSEYRCVQGLASGMIRTEKAARRGSSFCVSRQSDSHAGGGSAPHHRR